jgi:ATP-binding cassette subfamily B protein
MKSLTKQTLNIFWQHTKKYKNYAYGALFFLLMHSIAESSGPFFYKQLINTLTSYNPSLYKHALVILGFILAARFVRSYSFRLKDYLQTIFEARTMTDLNNTCFDYIHNNSYSFFSGNFVGSLVNKVKKYERGFETVCDRIIDDFIRTFLAIIFAVVMLSIRHIILGLALLLWCILYTAVIYFFSLYKLKIDLKKSELDTKITAQLADTFTNNTNIKLFANFEKEKKDFRKITTEHYNIRQKSWHLMTYLETFQSTLMFLLEAFMVFISIKLWSEGKLTVGDFTLIQLYIISIFDRLWGMGKQVRMFYEGLADANEMTEILLTPHEIQDAPNAGNVKVKKGAIEFKNVDFGYYKKDIVLNNFNLTLKPGEKVALIGPSGGGKSTLVKLLLRFHDIQSGEILIDDQNIAGITQDSLRNSMALVPQDPILFHRTLMENIRYGKPKATDKEVIGAARAAHASEFIERSQHGYETFVGERGIKLSGGQRQRIAIARAILKNAPILILDEATSSLDSESEQYIQEALKTLMQNKTVIVIAHRLSTIMQMDRIIVLEDGKVIEQGKHKELLKVKEGTYQKLWQIQAGGFS